jgi:hypothetical protein
MKDMIRTLRFTVVLTFLMASFRWAMAQRGITEGLVRDEQGKPLPGASIVVKGRSNGTAASLNGQYQLNLSPGRHAIIARLAGHRKQQENRVARPGKVIRQDFMTAGSYKECGEMTVVCRARGEAAMNVKNIFNRNDPGAALHTGHPKLNFE